jgi:hypothetical protein
MVKSVLLAVAALAMSTVAPAAILVQSTFDVNDEGWRGGDFFSPDDDAAPVYSATGGASGGYISMTDFFPWTAFQASSAFLGDQSAAYGGDLSFYERVQTSDSIPAPVVQIGDGTGLVLQFFATPPITTLSPAWTFYSVSLKASAGWRVTPIPFCGNQTCNADPIASPAATEAQMQQVLSNLQFLNINSDWHTGMDTVDLDQVVLTAVPEPSTMILLVLGLAGCCVAKARSLKRAAR